jgi:hypothetical protein
VERRFNERAPLEVKHTAYRFECSAAACQVASLAAICAKALTVDRDSRYASPTDLAEDVERWLADEPVSASQESLADRAARWTRKHRAVAATILGSLVLLLAVGAIAAVQQARLAFLENAARREALVVSATFAARTVGLEMDRRRVRSPLLSFVYNVAACGLC